MTLRGLSEPDLGANQEGRHTEFLSVRTLARQARVVADELGFEMSGARIRAVVRAFVREGHTDGDLRTWLISYADPTGETAARNVDRERRP